MPCRGHTHIVVDPGDRQYLAAWLDLGVSTLHVHDLILPKVVAHLPGYIAQQWVMFHADTISAGTRADAPADFIMYMDTDAVLGLPITCASLFDSIGRVYLGGWPGGSQIQFAKSVEDFVGVNYTNSYM